jgi:hypothetical protein
MCVPGPLPLVLKLLYQDLVHAPSASAPAPTAHGEGASSRPMQRRAKGLYCEKNGGPTLALQTFGAKSKSLSDATTALSACESYCTSNSKCTACSVHRTPSEGLKWLALSECGNHLVGLGIIVGDVSLKYNAPTFAPTQALPTPLPHAPTPVDIQKIDKKCASRNRTLWPRGDEGGVA